MRYIVVIALVVFFTSIELNSGFTKTFLSLVNDHRESIGLKKLIQDDEIDDVVTNHSEQMAEGKIAFGHLGFTDRCAESRKILRGANWCGENVARGQKTPERVFTAWMNSPGHKANIENPRATHTGFGYAKDEKGKIYWTQIFLEKK